MPPAKQASPQGKTVRRRAAAPGRSGPAASVAADPAALSTAGPEAVQRAVDALKGDFASPEDMLALQDVAGNRAVPDLLGEPPPNRVRTKRSDGVVQRKIFVGGRQVSTQELEIFIHANPAFAEELRILHGSDETVRAESWDALEAAVLREEYEDIIARERGRGRGKQEEPEALLETPPEEEPEERSPEELDKEMDKDPGIKKRIATLMKSAVNKIKPYSPDPTAGKWKLRVESAVHLLAGGLILAGGSAAAAALPGFPVGVALAILGGGQIAIGILKLIRSCINKKRKEVVGGIIAVEGIIAAGTATLAAVLTGGLWTAIIVAVGGLIKMIRGAVVASGLAGEHPKATGAVVILESLLSIIGGIGKVIAGVGSKIVGAIGGLVKGGRGADNIRKGIDADKEKEEEE